MLGAILTGVLTRAGLPAGLSALIAVAACAVIGGGFYLVGLRPARHATIAQSVLITIGFSILIRGTVTTIWSAEPIPVPPFTGNGDPLDVFGVSILPQELWLIGTLAVVSVATAGFFQRTVIGLALRAGASNPLGAAFVGIDHRRLGFYAFVAAGLLGGLGGAVWAPISLAQVDVGLSLGLKGFTAAALGGFSTAFGPIVGGLILVSLRASATASSRPPTRTRSPLACSSLCCWCGRRGCWEDCRAPRPRTSTRRSWSTSVSATRFTRADLVKFVAGIVVLGALGQVLEGVWLTTAIFAEITAIVVMGLVFTGYCGQLSLGQGAFMMIGGYSSAFLTVREGWPALPAMALGVVLAGASTALALGRMIFRLRGYYLSMASLGLLMIALTFAREESAITGGPNGLPGIPPLGIAGMSFYEDRQFYYVGLAVSLAVLMLGTSLTHSRFARALLAIRSINWRRGPAPSMRRLSRRAVSPSAPRWRAWREASTCIISASPIRRRSASTRRLRSSRRSRSAASCRCGALMSARPSSSRCRS